MNKRDPCEELKRHFDESRERDRREREILFSSAIWGGVSAAIAGTIGYFAITAALNLFDGNSNELPPQPAVQIQIQPVPH